MTAETRENFLLNKVGSLFQEISPDDYISKFVQSNSQYWITPVKKEKYNIDKLKTRIKDTIQ